VASIAAGETFATVVERASAARIAADVVVASAVRAAVEWWPAVVALVVDGAVTDEVVASPTGDACEWRGVAAAAASTWRGCVDGVVVSPTDSATTKVAASSSANHTLRREAATSSKPASSLSCPGPVTAANLGRS